MSKGIFDLVMDFGMSFPERMLNFFNRPFGELKNIFLIIIGVTTIAVFFWWFILWQ